MVTRVSTAPTKLLRPGGMREFLRIAAEATVVGLVASVALLVAALFIATAEASAPSEAPTSGTLLFSHGDARIPAPLVATDVQVDVSGIVARTRLTQHFVNDGEDWREGVYVFPLPENAAVDHLDVRIGERRIVGRIRERAQAKREYEQAKQEGKKAALVEQERPNLFTTSVAPIGPGETIVVSIEYQQTLRYDSGAFSLRIPLAVTPRYLPGTPVGTRSGDGWGADTDRVADGSRITPPVVHPAAGKVLPVTLGVTLDAGFPLAKVTSRYHAVRIQEEADGRHSVEVEGPVPADRDFELEWRPDVGRAPGAAVFIEPKEGKAYALVMLAPSVDAASMPRVQREATFVIDTSGSMAGPSIVQAKAALAFALDRLQPGDRFNVIEFNSKPRALFPAPMPVDSATLSRARSFVAGLKAEGGTEVREALELALRPAASGEFVRQVVFLTDGAVGNESELFALIRERLDDRRLFTVGIGTAPNSHFMTKAAQFGRGTFTYVADSRDVQERMAQLFTKLESPVLTDIAIDWPQGTEAWPERVPDLYAGEPIVVSAAMPSIDGEIGVRGIHGGRPWSARLPIADNGAASGVAVLWARAKIAALEDLRIAGANADDVRAEIVRVALAHHVVSRHTSLVAVDVTPTAPASLALAKTAVPGNLPHGQEHEAIFGGLPQTATPAARDALVAIVLMLVAMTLLALSRRRLAHA